MGFESAHFKLSHEMTQLLDPSGTMKSDTWNQFLSDGLWIKIPTPPTITHGFYGRVG